MHALQTYQVYDESRSLIPWNSFEGTSKSRRGDNQSRSQEKQQQLQEDFAGLYATTDIHSITQTNESKQRGGLSFCYVLYSALYIYADLGYLMFLVRGLTENY